MKQPQFGNIQRLRAVDSSWINVDSFTSNQIHLGQVRYIHNTDSPVHDDFKVGITNIDKQSLLIVIGLLTILFQRNSHCSSPYHLDRSKVINMIFV